VDPDDPNSVTEEILETFGTATGFLHNFFLGGEERIDAFLKRIDSESPWDKSLIDSVVIGMDDDSIFDICRLLNKISLVALKAVGDRTGVFGPLSAVHFAEGEKNYFHRGRVRAHAANSLALISIKFSAYDENNGIARKGGHYCYTRKYYEETKKRNVGCQQKNIYGSVFHELDHTLHWFEGRDKFDQTSTVALTQAYGRNNKFIEKWGNDEEFLTIAGVSYDINKWIVDPVSCAAFCCSEKKKGTNNYNIRCFHTVPFGNRIGIDTEADAIPVISSVVDMELIERFICGIFS
jgi:hypothetical protein